MVTPTPEYDFVVFIGRFQPFHIGHQAVIETALSKSTHCLVLCGSAHQPRSLRNPWDFDERERMIRAAFPKTEATRLQVLPLMDAIYNEADWIRNVQETVQGQVRAHFTQPHRAAKIALIGHNKDHSSYYLKLFPQWDSIAVDNVDGVNATQIRTQLLSDATLDEVTAKQLPATSQLELAKFTSADAFKQLTGEQAFINDYQAQWANAPYPVTFTTVDAVVVQSGHVLLVERRLRPGKGLWALPGGFVNTEETLLDAAIRELREETRLKIPVPVLRGCMDKQKVFDSPTRSTRGRTITHAFLFNTKAESKLPKVRGTDDAKRAFWVPLAELDTRKMYEDHYFIIQSMLG